MLTELHVRNFFDRYASRMNLALACDPIDTEWLSQAFAEHFIGADPNGIRAGKNNKEFEGAIRAHSDNMVFCDKNQIIIFEF
jgi:hypothetical protein